MPPDNCPLGAAALAGTSYPLDRQMTAAELGFAGVIPNSLDAVSDRDFLLDLHYAGSVMAMHLSRLSEENRAVVELRIRLYHAFRLVFHRLVYHAAEEEPRLC